MKQLILLLLTISVRTFGASAAESPWGISSSASGMSGLGAWMPRVHEARHLFTRQNGAA